MIDLGYGDDSSESNTLTPASTSSFGHSVMSKRGKTGYDVQKSLSGLMLNSKPSAETRKPFVPPAQKRKVEEDSVDDNSLFNMYTAVKTRPKTSSARAPPNFQRKASGTLLSHGKKRSKFRNPFKIDDQDAESKEMGAISR